jgi:hypothetical protein
LHVSLAVNALKSGSSGAYTAHTTTSPR